jgi:peptide/nickel transport system substrate-binding protein
MYSISLRTIWQRSIAVLLVAVLAILSTACSLDSFRTQAAQVPRLVVSTVGEPKTFNVALNEESPNVFGMIYEGMLSENGITGELEPALAESWEISPDNLNIVFTLRDGLRWSDGEPLTAADIVFTYNDIYANEQIPTASRDGLRVGETGKLPAVRQLDPRRVEFTVPEPFAPLLRVVGLNAILPAHILREFVFTTGSDGEPLFNSVWGTNTNPAEIVGNGAYVLENYVPSQRVVFRRNPYYWRQDAQGQQMPYVEQVIWQIVESTDNSLMEFRSGGLDMVGVNASNFSLLKREENRGDFTIYNGGPAFGTTYLTFNLNKARRKNGSPLVDPVRSRWFNTLAFRQAVAHAIDRPTMINNIYRGLGEPQDSPISVQSPYYLSPQEGLKAYDFNPETAKRLLQGAGFRYNAANQLVDADGNRVRFTLLAGSGSPTIEAIAAQIKRDLSSIGMQVDLQIVTFNTLVDRITVGLDWEAYILGYTGSVEPHGGINVWSPDGRLHDFNLQPDDPNSIEGREIADWEAEIGQLYIQGARELDETRRREIYAKTQQLAQEYVPFIHLVNPLSLAAIRNKVENAKFSALGGTTWNIHELRLRE